MSLRMLAMVLVLGCAGCDQGSIGPKSNPSEQTVVKKLSEIPSRYVAASAEWEKFLACWAKQMGQPYSPAIGYETPEKLKTLAAGPLPKSYLDFVQATGGAGWVLPGDKQRFGEDTPALFSINKIGLFKTKDKVTWKAWADNKLSQAIPDKVYYNYTESQDVGLFRDAYLDSLVLVGDMGGGAVLVLNPLERTQDGEWEAWYLSTRMAGALRYRSFGELIQLVFFTDVDPSRQLDRYSRKEMDESCAQWIFKHFRSID